MAEVSEGELIERGAIPPDDFHEAIERIREVANWDVEVPQDLTNRLQTLTKDLLLSPDFLVNAAAALSVGHLVLQGPPGTGKSRVARTLCRAYGAAVLPVTAHEDWSTFEVIGRQELRINGNGREELVAVNGYFTEAVIQCAGWIVRHFDDPAEPQATWLLIDELNRAHLDKAFGELFTVLGTDELVEITLPHQRQGNNALVTPRRFRIIATLNSIDKQFVNSLSQGLRRRFTFLTLDIPPRRDSGEPWGNGDSGASLGSREFTVVIESAVARMIQRRLEHPTASDALSRDDLRTFLATNARPQMEALFDLVERVRYAPAGSEAPYLAIGTALLIDTTELFLSRAMMHGFSGERLDGDMDWAASVKLAQLFDADTINPAQLQQFAETILSPFQRETRRELLQITAAGMYYVE